MIKLIYDFKNSKFKMNSKLEIVATYLYNNVIIEKKIFFSFHLSRKVFRLINLTSLTQAICV